jgi:hypothetical protein
VSSNWSRERPIHVIATGPGKHLFSHLGDPRVQMLKATKQLRTPPRVLVMPLQSRTAFDDAKTNVHPDTWKRVAEGQATLVFDMSGEGEPHTAERTAALHDFVEGLAISPCRCAYVTQDRNYAREYAAHLGDPTAPALRVLNYDYYIKRFFQQYETNGDEAFEERLAAFRARTAVRERRFVCLNRAARSNKLFFLLALLRDGLWDRGFISFSGFDKAASQYAKTAKFMLREMRATPGFEELTRDLTPFMADLAAKGQVVLGRREDQSLDDFLLTVTLGEHNLPERQRSWFTVVNETEITGPHRITEKPFKSLIDFHPTIVIGNAGALPLIRELGFRTFDGYFDETYDAEPDARARFDAVYGQLRRLCERDEAELARMEAEIAETLAFNAEWGLKRLPAVYRDIFDPRFVDSVMAGVEA